VRCPCRTAQDHLIPAMAERPGRVRYRFPPLERRGVIAGWRGGQIAAVAAGLVIGVLALRSRPSAGGVAFAVSCAAAGVALAFWPIQGRTGEQWLPLVARWLWSGSRKGRRQSARAPRLGQLAAVDAAPKAWPRVPDRLRATGRRGVFDGMEIAAVPAPRGTGGADIGVVLDRPSRTVTAVMAVRGHSFALLSGADQDSRIAAWARVLSTLAREGSEIHRVQWVESCVPDDGTAVCSYVDAHAVLGPESAAGRSYRELVAESSPITRRHAVLLGLSVHTARSARAIRAAGGGMAGAGTVLAREVVSLHRALEGADVVVDGVLGPAALSRVLADAHRRTHDRGGAEQRPCWPWPMAVEPAWEAVHVDATWHATYWIAEWPRVDVDPDFLGPLLFTPLRRSISLVMEPVPPNRAARQVAQARTADLADHELRRRGGFLTTARHHRERESVEARDDELADGHAQMRFTGYVTVTAETRDDLADACGAIEQAAGQARLELRLLYGEQDLAFACTLPVGRGLS
jgi:Putative type VII ESX secretion system translocon, EccE